MPERLQAQRSSANWPADLLQSSDSASAFSPFGHSSQQGRSTHGGLERLGAGLIGRGSRGGSAKVRADRLTALRSMILEDADAFIAARFEGAWGSMLRAVEVDDPGPRA
jgi:hypothetical protein